MSNKSSKLSKARDDRLDFGFILFAIYLAVSTVYWLPGISPELLRVMKISLFGVAMMFTWSKKRTAGMSLISRLPFGIPTFSVVLISSSIGFMLADKSEIVGTLIDFSLSFATLWSFYSLAGNSRQTATLMTSSAIAIACLCIPGVTNYIIGFPNWTPPAEYVARRLSDSGFGALRTGWSNGLSLYVPLLLLPVLLNNFRSNIKFVSAGLIFVTLASQYIAGGRAGLLSSGLAVLTMTVLLPPSGKRGRSVIAALGAVVAAILLLSGPLWGDRNEVVSHLRLNRLSGGFSWSTMDDFSAGRMLLIRQAFEQFREQPFGSGFGHAVYGTLGESDSFTRAEVHNLWIKLLVEAGPFLVVTLVLFVAFLVNRIWKSLPKLRRLSERFGAPYSTTYGTQVAYLTIVGQGLFISQFEPNALIGSFQATAVWWAAAGVALRSAAIVANVENELQKQSDVTRKLHPALR